MSKRKKHVNDTNHSSFFQSLFYVIASVIVALVLVRLPAFHAMMTALGSFGYLGAFLGGMTFVSIFTAAPGAAVLMTLRESLNPLLLAVVAGLGGMIGDYLIMSFIKHEAKNEIQSFPKKQGILTVVRCIRHSKYRLLVAIIGAIVVASPLPDEIGLSLMGISRIKGPWFFFITFLLDFFGIYAMITLL